MRFVVGTANAVIRAHGGRELAFEQVGRMSGLPLEAIFRLAWPNLSAAAAAAYRDEYRERYARVAIPATKLYRGARTTLRAFHAAGFLQVTVTGKRAADCERILRGLGIARDIDLYLGGDSVSRPKPAPDLAREAIARAGVAPSETIVVGDTRTDMAMGRAAGARTIEVLWGYERAPVPEADVAVRTWPELRAAVFGLAGLGAPMLRGGGPLRS